MDSSDVRTVTVKLTKRSAEEVMKCSQVYYYCGSIKKNMSTSYQVVMCPKHAMQQIGHKFSRSRAILHDTSQLGQHLF